MRYLWSLLLLLLFAIGPVSQAAERRGGQRSSLPSVRKPQKPRVYHPKQIRPAVVKKKRWWQRR